MNKHSLLTMIWDFLVHWRNKLCKGRTRIMIKSSSGEIILCVVVNRLYQLQTLTTDGDQIVTKFIKEVSYEKQEEMDE